MTIAERLWNGESLNVKVSPNSHGIPETRFRIDVKRVAGVRGFRSTVDGQKPSTGHKILSRAAIDEWAEGLELV